jgi:8-oxo-dGTP pyrophosphatase MutT (NUDIX family)
MAKAHKDKGPRIAVVPVIVRKKKRSIGLVTSRAQQQWIIPTGKTERKLSNRQVAALEAFEEGGMLGKLDKRFKLEVLLPSPCGQFQRKTTVFVLYVKRMLKNWPEHAQRRRKQVSVKTYLQSLPSQKLRRHLAAAGVLR